MSSIKSQIVNIRVNGCLSPIGVETAAPIYSWEFATPKSSVYMENYRIIVSNAFSKEVVWDSGETAAQSPIGIKHDGSPLEDNTAYIIEVTACLEGELLRQKSGFRTGYIEKPVPASPKIFACEKMLSPLIRNTFFTGSVIANATLFVSGNCLYRPYINDLPTTSGFIIGTAGVAQAFDVSTLLTSNNNTLGLWLRRDPYGYSAEAPYIQCALHFTSIDGERVQIDLSSDWICKQSPISNNGSSEIYDKRQETKKWCDSYISVADWQPCIYKTGNEIYCKVTKNCDPLLTRKSRHTETLEDDLARYDFGAITAGYVNAKVMGEPGAKLIIKYAKTLNELQDSEEKDVYIIKGHEIELFEPRFSMHLFRYAELYIDGVAQLITAEATVLGSKAEHPTKFLCNCISHYKEYVSVLKGHADYTVIPKSYRTLESIILNTDPLLLENHFLGLEQLGIKSLANEILSDAYAKIAGVIVNGDKREIIIDTHLPPDAESLSYERQSVYGKIGVYLRRIAGEIHTDFIIPPCFTATVTMPDGSKKKLKNGKYMSEQFKYICEV